MRILVHVPSYFPTIGGVETAALNFVEQLTRLDHEVVVVTKSESYGPDESAVGRGGYLIVYDCAALRLLKLTWWCEICVHVNVNLRTLWPLALVRRPWGIVHHHRLRQITHACQHAGVAEATNACIPPKKVLSLNDRTKRRIAQWANLNIAVSSSLAEDLGFVHNVIPNCYDDQAYFERCPPGVRDTRKILFVGRFVSEKGHWLLFQALEILNEKGVPFSASFVGEGPLFEEFSKRVRDHPTLRDRITLVWSVQGPRLAHYFRTHGICVVPSVVPETFGLVALEAMACGCVVVGADDGAIPWVVEGVGRVFRSGDTQSLAAELEKLIVSGSGLDRLGRLSGKRAKEFRPDVIGQRYAKQFEQLLEVRRPLVSQSRSDGRLRILLVTTFYPNVGGMETVFSILANEWSAMGHEVRVIHPGPVRFHASLLHPPNVLTYSKPERRTIGWLHRWCDVVVHGSLNARYLWAILYSGKPCIVTQHGSVTRTGLSPFTKVQRVKRWLSRRFPNITCSRFVAEDLGVRPLATGNPYRNDIYRMDSRVPRDRELVFVGRFVSDKGFGLLVQALGILRDRGLRPKLTAIGTGDELPIHRECVQRLGLTDQVEFAGVLEPELIADQLRRHRVLVVPSSFWEPFGIVALEGIACGCLVVASRGGGMPESVGPCGILFDNNSLEGLVDGITTALSGTIGINEEDRENHLRKYHASTIARDFLEEISKVIPGKHHKILATRRATVAASLDSTN